MDVGNCKQCKSLRGQGRLTVWEKSAVLILTKFILTLIKLNAVGWRDSCFITVFTLSTKSFLRFM